MSITIKSVSCCILTLWFLMSGSALANLLQTTEQVRKQEEIENQKRELIFQRDEQSLEQVRNALVAKRLNLQGKIKELSEQFSNNELILARSEEKLHIESGSLGELFGVAKQVAKQFQVEQKEAITAINESEYLSPVNTIVEGNTLPSKVELYGLWYAFQRQLEVGSSITEVDVPYILPDGIVETKKVQRVGPFGLVDDSQYLQWFGEKRGAKPYQIQPQFVPVKEVIKESSILFTLDPTGGTLIERLSLVPTVTQRIEQSGVIGKVILVLLAIGVSIGVVQGAFLLITRMKINAQLKDKDNIGSNALGRVLGVYKYDQSPNVEALELRLYETILDEQQKLERGLSMLKLLAALSPMLGLLGTVTGMIETFQVITQFGNADPRMMAAGISTALITTVLGLVSAMPMLFMHNILSTQAENVRTLLEKQGVGLVAQRAEQDARKT